MSSKITAEVSLMPLPQERFNQWRAHSIYEFAKDKERTLGIAPEEALKLSQESFASELTEGLSTPGHHILSVLSSAGHTVGSAWVSITAQHGVRRAFVLDIEIEPAERGKGYGRAAMLELENMVKKRGVETIGLHVFAFNEAAKSLYTSIGYEVTDWVLAKQL
jgi:ribosomal protein S18 acetylase RimI-like enzyme